MRKVQLSILAESDLLDIWQYTFEEWDDAQADRYLDELDEAFRLLAENPGLGTSRHYVREGYRVFFVNRHAVYYTVTNTVLRVIRILHGQMDPDRHL
jgi:toxin ParE1/3/4